MVFPVFDFYVCYNGFDENVRDTMQVALLYVKDTRDWRANGENMPEGCTTYNSRDKNCTNDYIRMCAVGVKNTLTCREYMMMRTFLCILYFEQDVVTFIYLENQNKCKGNCVILCC